MREVDLSGLPIYACGTYKGKIDWKNSVGCKCEFVYDDVKGEVQIIGYEKEKTTLNIRFGTKEYKLKTGSFTKSQFGKMLDKFTSDFKVEIGTIFKDDKGDIIIIDRKYIKRIRSNGRIESQKWYRYKCNRCYWDNGWIEESHLLNRNGRCSCCNGKTVVPGINDIATTDPWMIPYLVNKEDAYRYTSKSSKKVKVKCPDCGVLKNKKIPLQRLKSDISIGCSCSDGKPYDEKLFYHIVNEQLGLNMLWGANKNDYPWMDKYIYDFVDEKNKIIWELDGGLGHGNKIYSKGKITKEESEEIDRIKDELGRKNGYKVIRINTNYNHNKFDYIKYALLNSEFNKMYDVKNIIWNNAHEFALSNLVKKVCEYYENHLELNQREISEHFELHKDTIKNYLIQGERVGWCTNVKKRGVKAKSNCGKNRRKTVFCNELNESFESVLSCSIKLSNRFGFKFSKICIGKVCRNEQNQHHGFHFKYISCDN